MGGMRNQVGFAMHGLLRMNQFCTKKHPQCLMPQAHAEDGNMRMKMTDNFHGDAGLQGRFWARRNDEARGADFSELLNRYFIVFKNGTSGACLQKIMMQDVGKRIVIIN